jgi:FAD/FMN-containing dehydrogenase
MAADLLQFWQQFITTAPEHINGWFAALTVPPHPPFPEHVQLTKMCAINWCYTGPLDQAESAFKAIRAFGPPAVDFARPISWPALQSMFDALYPPGLQWYWKADFFKELSPAAINLQVKYAEQLPTMHSTMHIYPINGAAQRAGRGDTAFAFRDANFAEVIVGVDPDPANNARMIQWARDYWLALHPHSAGGGYVNMMMDEGDAHVRAAYRENYDRLAQLKAAFDPANLFHTNQNIRPNT